MPVGDGYETPLLEGSLHRKHVKIDIKTFEQLLLPDSSGRSLKGLFGVVESWNKNRNDDVLSRVRYENARRQFLKGTAFSILCGSFISLIFTLLLVFGPLAVEKLPLLATLILGIWFFVSVGSSFLFMCLDNHEYKTPKDLTDFERLLSWLECKLGNLDDPEGNDKWNSFKNVQEASKDLASSVMCRLADCENMEKYHDLSDPSYVPVLNMTRKDVFDSLALLASAGLISRDKSQYDLLNRKK
jgi:uncharacterized membrane protein